jgi:hypothetical protein
MVSIDLRALVLASLATVPSACSVPPTPFEIDAVVHDPYFYSDKPLAEWDCKTICQIALNESHGHGHNNWGIRRLDSCEFERAEPDLIHVTCSGGYRFMQEGRRPFAQLEREHPRSLVSELGATLAELAYLEAASILAFTELAAQLERLGAPAELIERCQAAAVDERRHASVLAALARQHGVEPLEPHAPTCDALELIELARHNAVEGCVLESFAALIACVRAATAGEPVLREAYRSIANDELRHGQLAWEIHAWAYPQLDERARARVLSARSHALAALPKRARSLTSLPPGLQRLGPDVAVRLAREFANRITAASAIDTH